MRSTAVRYMIVDGLRYQLPEEPHVESLSGDGKRLRDEVRSLPLGRELASSGLLVVSVADKGNVAAACGIRSPLNVLVLYVVEGFRGRGIGSRVLTKTVDVARKHRLNFVTLSVSSDNVVAHRIYSMQGFKELVHLRKARLILMINPLSCKGWLIYEFLRGLCSLLPNSFLASIHARLYERTF